MQMGAFCMRFIYLSDTFYQEYARCPEIMAKRTRPYACLAVRIDGVPFAIPIRHHISHSYAFITKPGCGLDYSKAVVIRGPEDVRTDAFPQIDQQEFNAMKGRDRLIENGMRRYVALYKKARLHPESPFYQNILRWSTLQYFIPYLYRR